jgi:fatty acid desaturase
MTLAADNRMVMDLTRRDSGAGARQLALHLALLAATGAGVWLALGSLWVWPAMLLHGVALCALFAPLHETVHRTVFRQRRANDALASAIGALLLLPADWFRDFHMAHHRYTQDPARDPELLSPKPGSLASYLVYVSGWYYWRRQLPGIVTHALGRVDEPYVRDRSRVVREARLLLAAYAAVAVLVAAGWQAPLWYWLLPVLLGQPFLRLYLLAEHTGCPEVPDMWRNTRTTRSNALVRRLMWNMPYHTEHHAFPAVPFHALPALHERVRDRLRVTAPSYTAVHRELVRGLRSEGR